MASHVIYSRRTRAAPTFLDAEEDIVRLTLDGPATKTRLVRKTTNASVPFAALGSKDVLRI